MIEVGGGHGRAPKFVRARPGKVQVGGQEFQVLARPCKHADGSEGRELAALDPLVALRSRHALGGGQRDIRAAPGRGSEHPEDSVVLQVQPEEEQQRRGHAEQHRAALPTPRNPERERGHQHEPEQVKCRVEPAEHGAREEEPEPSSSRRPEQSPVEGDSRPAHERRTQVRVEIEILQIHGLRHQREPEREPRGGPLGAAELVE